jgi:DNA-binding response OmpR family regulator
MPGFSGFEICQTLASLSFTQHIPVLIVSGEPAAKYQNLCENLGAAGYFEKPLHIEQLKTRLSALVTSKRPERRKEPRARLHVVLKLTGTDRVGMEFELLTTTENVSASGFSCGCTVELEKGAIVQVYLQSEDSHYVGSARAAWSEWRTTGCPRYGFGFVEKPTRWILG